MISVRQVVFDSEGTLIINIELEDYCVFSCINCMPNRSTTQGAGPIDNSGERREYAHEIQRAFIPDTVKHMEIKHKLCYFQTGWLVMIWFILLPRMT